MPAKKPLPATRDCRRCGAEKPIELFKLVGRPLVPSRVCKACDAARARERWHADLERNRARRRDYYRKNSARILARARGRARPPLTARQRAAAHHATRRWRDAHPDAIAAHNVIKAAIKRSEVKRPTDCDVLNCTATRDLHLHHPNYAKPREVVCLCRQHHEDIHHIAQLPAKPGRSRKIIRAPREYSPAAKRNPRTR